MPAKPLSSRRKGGKGDRGPGEEDEEDDETTNLVKNFKQFFGWGDEVADDADWVTLTYHNRNASKLVER